MIGPTASSRHGIGTVEIRNMPPASAASTATVATARRTGDSRPASAAA